MMTDDEIRQEAHDEWVKSNTWGLTRDDFIRLSYFHGCMDNGSDGKGPINGSEDGPGDVVYRSPEGSALTRAMVSYWFADSNAFMHGYTKALLKHNAELGRNFGDALQAAFDRGLKAGNEQGNEQQLCIHRLQDEIEAMRKDAERYRWLRNKANGKRERAPIVVVADSDFDVTWRDVRTDHDLDEAIDAELGE